MALSSASRRPAMLHRLQQRKHKPDYLLVLLSTVLLAIGLIVVYAISPGLSEQQNVSENYYVSKQFTAIGLGIVTFLIAANLKMHHIKQLKIPLIIAASLVAVAVHIFGQEVNGATRWVQIGGLSFQAVELIKFAVLIWLAGFLANRVKENNLQSFDKTFKPILIALAGVSIVVAVFQSDLGSVGVLAAMFLAMCFVAGLPMKRILMVIGILAIGTVLAISSTGYRRDRFMTFLQPESDCQSAGYQACQALIAIGSGGMFGQNVGGSVQAYGYLPESANDSIFAIFAEMFGFVGSVVLIGLFVALFARMRHIMERAPDVHSRLLIVGVLAWLSTQALINIGAMLGVLPLKGITLPFISYGGTSIIFVTATIGIVFNVSRYTTYGVNNLALSEGKGNESTFDWRRNRRAHYAPSGRRARA
ncbi:MAG: putative peptidoglycan glycosyltransferase FtsW [Candidatus Saccharibacteria bacterium]|nr:putative peptidoglycan glycosyltransferase FtsW [Candidatus Saccharibacteria bacterium]